MKIHALLVVAAASLIVGGVLTASDEDEAIKKDRKRIAGTWRVISYEKDGKKTADEQLERTRTIFSADGKFRVQRDGTTSFKEARRSTRPGSPSSLRQLTRKVS